MYGTYNYYWHNKFYYNTKILLYYFLCNKIISYIIILFCNDSFPSKVKHNRTEQKTVSSVSQLLVLSFGFLFLHSNHLKCPYSLNFLSHHLPFSKHDLTYQSPTSQRR